MNLLINTSQSQLMIALADGERVVSEFTATATPAERGIHDSRLAMESARLIEGAGIQPKDIERIGIVIGPGSFTGLRIGLSFAKGFMMGSSAKLVPIIVHEALAKTTADEHDWIVTPAYQPGLYYVARWSRPGEIELLKSGEWHLTKSARLVGPEELRGFAEEQGAEFRLAEITLPLLAGITANAKTVLEIGEIGDIEPLYVTEFTAKSAT